MNGADRARSDLNALLTRFEANPSSARLSMNVVREAFASQGELDDYIAVLVSAEKQGALQLKARRGRDRHAPPKVQLVIPDALYTFLGRVPSARIAHEALGGLHSFATHAWMAAAFDDVGAAWRRGRDWWGLGPEDAARVGFIAQLAEEIIAGRHIGLDYRSLSVQVAKDSKFLEKHEAALLRFLSFARELPPGHPRAVLSALGLDRIAMPFHLSGPIILGEQRIPTSIPYIAVPHVATSEIGLSRSPRCLLLIENFVSFHRHAIEANANRDDLVVYTGGQPSLWWQQSMITLRGRLAEDLPIFHWSDIDWGGLEIFKKLESLLGKVMPHLMSIDVAETYGVPIGEPPPRIGQFQGSAVEALAEYLVRPGSKCVEQEVLEPSPPVVQA